jgi:hypothetical protein
MEKNTVFWQLFAGKTFYVSEDAFDTKNSETEDIVFCVNFILNQPFDV